MGMALAAYIIHEATPIDEQAGSDDYPGSAERFISLVGNPDFAGTVAIVGYLLLPSCSAH